MPKQIKQQHHGIANFLAFALMPLSGFATDIYLPSLPAMAGSLQVSHIQVQLTLSLFLISYGVGQLFVGSLLDSFGRYNLGLVSLVLFVVASLVIAHTRSIFLIDIMRVVHGLTVSGIVVAKRAYFIDLYSGERLKHYLSLFTIIWSTGPIIAPFLGGYFQEAFGWQFNFYFLAIFAAVLAVAELIFSGETLKQFAVFNIRSIVAFYGSMIRTVPFMLGILMCGMAYSMVMVFNMTGPFIIEHQMGLSPVVAGYSSFILGISWMAGGFLGKATLKRPFVRRLGTNLALQLFFVILMLVFASHITNVYTLIAFAFVIQVSSGYTFNNFYTYCLSRFPKNAGIASGFAGGTNYVVISALSYLVVSFFPGRNAQNLVYSYLLLTLMCIIVMWLLSRRPAALEN